MTAGLPGPRGEPTAPTTPRYRPAQVEKAPPCQLQCPNEADIRRWIGFVAQRDKLGLTKEQAYTRAWETIMEVNPFPAVLGRVCPHPCQTLCNRDTHDEPLAINAMEQFLGDFAIQAGLRPQPVSTIDGAVPSESIGVIGAGPSGLSFAYQLARRGYGVTIYERRPFAGGMLRYGIPDYRLPPDVLDAEIERILDLGVELQLGIRIGEDVTLDEIRRRHDDVYVGIGAQTGRRLGIPGEDGPAVWTGTEYLERVNGGEMIDLGRRVVVVGGGNTAVDAARTARRTGATVSILYRRSRAEMPAIEQEVDDAIEEGVDLQLHVAPARLERDGDALLELVATRMTLGPEDASGRRRPVPVAGSEFAIKVDAVIAAVSQEPDLTGLETVLTDGQLRADEGIVDADLLAGGDALAQGIAAQAIVQGRLAAEALHRRLRGLPRPAATGGRAMIRPEALLLDFYARSEAAQRPRRPAAERLADPRVEVAAGLGEAAFLAEANRCLSCGSCFGCEQCTMYCMSEGFIKLDSPQPGTYFDISLDRCEECGKCVSVCPCGYLEVLPG
jgi:NADPH-dependent glutamate synthase beta subunit-like oxidoreductase/ferredoxin